MSLILLTVRLLAHIERTRRDLLAHNAELMKFVERTTEKLLGDVGMAMKHSHEREMSQRIMMPPKNPMPLGDHDINTVNELREWNTPT